MPKSKPKKGLLKRIRFTKSGRVKFRRAFGRHRRSHKSGKLLQSYRKPTYMKSCDIKRVRMLTFTSVASRSESKDESAGSE